MPVVKVFHVLIMAKLAAPLIPRGPVIALMETAYMQHFLAPGALLLCAYIIWVYVFTAFMVAHMLTRTHDFQVFDSIITFIFVYVMNYFKPSKLTFKVLFHYVTMFLNTFTVNNYASIGFHKNLNTSYHQQNQMVFRNKNRK